nr:hypothetical protein [Bartonella schoenbuchensis]
MYAVGGENLVMRLEGVKISEVGTGVYVKRGKSLTIGGENSTISLADGGRYGAVSLYTSPSPRDRTRSRMPSSA